MSFESGKRIGKLWCKFLNQRKQASKGAFSSQGFKTTQQILEIKSQTLQVF
jgi:hypothetical protein